MDSTSVLGAAFELFRARHYPGVVAACADALVDLAPGDTSRGPIHLLAARSLLALRRDAQAQAEIRECLRIDPQCAAAYRLLGELAARADELPSAKIFLREAIRLAPDDLEAHEWLALVDRMARPAPAAASTVVAKAAVGRAPGTRTQPPPTPVARPQPPAPRLRVAPLPLPPPSAVTPLPRARGTAPPPVAVSFGEYLVECGLLSPVQLKAAQAYQRSTGVRLGAAAVALGLVSEPKIEWASIAYHGRERGAHGR